MKSLNRRTISTLVTLFTIYYVLVTTSALAWTNPTVAPPGGDAGGLVNISSTGQSKLGSLTVSGIVGIGTASPNSSALVDISSTAKGLLVPRMTTAQRDVIASPQAGLFVYNMTTHQFNIYANSAWGAVAGSGDTNWTASGTAIFNTATSSNVGIGDSNPQSTLSVNGIISSPSGVSVRLQASGSVAGSGNNASIYFLDSTGATRGRFDAATTVPRTASLGSLLGSGADGAVTFASNANMNTTNYATGRTCADGGDMVSYSVTALTATTATLSASPSSGCLNANNAIILVNLQGISGFVSNVGNYEFLTVQGVAGNVVTFTASKTKFYGNNAGDDTNIGVTAGTNQRIILQRVPQFTNVTVNSGVTVTVNGYNYSTGRGGVLAFLATGTVAVSGTFTTTGYAGGAGSTSGSGNGCHPQTPGMPGQGLFYVNDSSGQGGSCSTSTNGVAGNFSAGGGGANNYNGVGTGGAGTSNIGAGGGGGGGSGSFSGGSAQGEMGGGGGGGGHATAGGGGGSSGNVANGANGTTSVSGAGGTAAQYYCCSGNINEPVSGGGGGGAANYGVADLTKLTMGSGGGGGGTGCNSGNSCGNGQAGGSGGGIIVVYGNSISVSGAINTNGGSGGTDTFLDGSGGGGAGGSVKLYGASLVLGSGLVTSSGGAGGSGGGAVGGAGGSGRIAAYYTTSLSGTTSPAAYSQNVGSNDPDTTKYYGTFYTGSTNVSSQDLAEWYDASDPTLAPGMLVSLDKAGKLIKAFSADSSLLGVISTNPGVTLGTQDTGSNAGQQKVALSGKVPTLVNTTNGPIQPGDLITVDPQHPGQGTKLMSSGWYVGRALQPLTQGAGSVEVFAGGGWYDEMQNDLIQSTINQYLQQIGISLQKGFAKFQDLTSKTITVNVLHMNGLEMPDTLTRAIYCTSMYNGALRIEQRACANQ